MSLAGRGRINPVSRAIVSTTISTHRALTQMRSLGLCGNHARIADERF
jgi:hypothetical protein